MTAYQQQQLELEPFVEQDCTVEFNGHLFESGGSFLCPGRDGLFEGILYAGDGFLQTWHGDRRWPARITHRWRGNMGDRRCTWAVTINGRRFTGRQCSCDWSQIVRLREVKTRSH